jgi:WD40 repeat protein
LGGGAIEIWDLALRKKTRTLRGHTRAVTSLVFSPDGKRLVSESWSDASTVLVWDTESGREVARLHGQHGWDVHFGGFASNGRVFMTGQKNGWLKVWDAATGELIAQDPGSQPGEWAPSGPVLAAAGEAKEPILFRVENWVKCGTWESPEPWDLDRDGLPFPRESGPDEPDRDATSGQTPRPTKPEGASHWTRLNAPGSSWLSKLFKKGRSGKDGGDQ